MTRLIDPNALLRFMESLEHADDATQFAGIRAYVTSMTRLPSVPCDCQAYPGMLSPHRSWCQEPEAVVARAARAA